MTRARPVVALAVAVVVAVALRLWHLTTPQAALDGDEAMTALMAQRILDGKVYVYLAGQTYNGALEQYLQAALFAVLPDGPLVLRLPQVAIAAAVTAMVYVLGVRMLPTRWHAALAALIFASGPFFNVWKGVRSHGGYGLAQLVGLVGLFCALRLREDGRHRPAWAFVLGLACGLGVWLSPMSAYLLVPAVLWAAGALARGPVRLIGGAVVGLALGMAPVLAWLAANGEVPGFGGPQPPSSLVERLGNLGGPVLRMFIGGSTFGDAAVWPRVLTVVALLALAGAYLAALLRRPRGLGLLLAVPPVVVALYVASDNTWYAREPRYLFVAYPALALGLAALVPRRGRAMLAGAAALLALVAGTSLVTLAQQADDGPRDQHGCLRAAADRLVENGRSVVYADYWTGLPLQFAAGDRLTVGIEAGGRWKFPEARRAVDAAPVVTYVAARVRDPMGQEEDPVVKHDRELAAHGVQARRIDLGCLVAWTDLRPQRRPWELGLGERVPADWRSYWGS